MLPKKFNKKSFQQLIKKLYISEQLSQ